MKKETSVKEVKITLVKSTISCVKKQKATVEALGLHKIGSSKVHKDGAVLQGMLKVVSHLVKVEEI